MSDVNIESAETRRDDSGRRHRVVVIGSGFGGLFGTKALRRADVDVTMIAKTTHHLFQPLLYQVATGILSEGEIAPPTREVLRAAGQRDGAARRGHRHRPRRTARSPRTCSAARLVTPYDSLMVAAGAGQSYFGNDQFAEFAPGMKSIDDALELRGRIFGAFELAEIMAAERRGRRPPADLRRRRRRPDRRRDGRARSPSSPSTPSSGTSARSTPAGPGDPGRRRRPGAAAVRRAKLGARTEKPLEKLGVEVQLGAMVVAVDERGLEVQDKDGTRRRIEAVTKIWAAGVQASAARADALRADRCRARPRRPDRGQPRPHPARAPRGVRRRRHDLPGQPARCRAGGDPGREVRRPGDRRPAPGQGAAAAVPVLRQGQHGHDLAVQRGRDASASSGSPGSSPG